MLRKKGLSEKYALTEVESFLMLFFDLNQIGKAVFTKKLFHLELLRNALFEEIKEIIVLDHRLGRVTKKIFFSQTIVDKVYETMSRN